MLFLVFVASTVVSVSCVNLEEIEKQLENNFDLDFLKDYFQFHLYVNPHPTCALEDELCTLDNNCCNHLECKVNADHEGVKYTCQTKVENNMTTDATEEVTNEEDVHWGFGEEGKDLSDESSNSLIREIFRTRLEKAKKDEEKLLKDQYYLIKELQKPLSMDEMRELQQMKELEEYKREKELKSLREWKKNREQEELQKTEKEETIQKLAKERVAKVLKEEERQKLESLKKVQEAMKRDLQKNQWF